MKVVTIYESADGLQFRRQEDCVEHEDRVEDCASANTLLENGGSLLAVLNRLNARSDRSYLHCYTAVDRAILAKITRATGFKISHWQCSDKPDYKPGAVNHDGRVYIGGSGGWSGSYGEWLTVADVLRYARGTPQIMASL